MRSRGVGLAIVWLVLGCAVSTLAAASDVAISELMASNQSTLADEDGDYSDWAEIVNFGDIPVDLGGWYLTDDATDRTKWRFPNGIELPPQSFLLVYCSGKDRRDPEGELHTNFRLSRGGEFFALVESDGVTIASEYSPNFPEQFADVSFGLPQEITETVFLESGASGKVVVPLSDALGMDWVQPDFADDGWLEGKSGFGFDQKVQKTYAELIQTDIGETMRRNNATAYIRVPFEVEDPSGLDFLQLRMKYEDGFVAYLNGVEVARKNAPPVVAWDSDAEGSHLPSLAVVFEENDISAFRDLLQPGRNLLAIHGLNSTATNSDFLILPELVGLSVGPLETAQGRFFEKPSPLFANGAGFDRVSEEPRFVAPSGVYAEEVEVEFVSPPAGSVIHFTTDHSEPSRDSPIYEGPFTLSETTTVRARLIEPDSAASPVVEETYLIADADLADFDSDLPLVVVTSLNLPSIDGFSQAYFHIVDRDVSGRSSITGAPHFSGRGGMRVRGSSTAGREKASWNLEIRDGTGDDLDVELLGMPEGSDWVLYGAYNFDRALIRNALVYQLSNDIGRWASRSRFVEVFRTSGSRRLSMSDYWGVYSLMEKIKRGPDRVDVESLEPTDTTEPTISGGYILKIDRPDPGDTGFFTDRGTPHSTGVPTAFGYVYPKEVNLNEAQAAWIQGYLNDMEDALYGPNFQDQQLGYARYLDVGSFIDHHLLNELTKNPDEFRLSGFYYKKRNGKLAAGPVWDFDRTMNPDDDGRARLPNGWATDWGYEWFGQLFKDPAYHRMYRQRWRDLRRGPLSTERIHATIDAMADEIREAQARNFERWPLALGLGGWQGQIDRIKDWLAARVVWMDIALMDPPQFSREGGQITPPVEVTLTNLNGSGEILYTLNGPDPRLGGGEAAPEALIFSDPILLTGNTRIRARVRDGPGVWSEMGEEVYFVSLPAVAITELMYNPREGTEFEFIELFNHGDDTVSLNGFSVGAVTLLSAEGSLEPNEYAVLARSAAALRTLYSENIKIVGEYSGSLSDSGEMLTLFGPLSEPILSFSFSDEWYPETDGGGHSLVLLDPRTSGEALEDPASWRPSFEIHGSPGFPDEEKLPGGQIAGDSNQDGKMNLSDAIHLLRFLFAGSPARLPCGQGTPAEAANILVLDTNADLQINAADVVYNLTYLFLNGSPPRQGTGCMAILECPEVCSE